MGIRWDIITGYMPMFLQGALMTVEITVIAVLIGTILGLLAGMARLANTARGFARVIIGILRFIAGVYVAFFRGTPLFVQILIVHFAVMPLLINPNGGWLVAGELAREIKSQHGALISGIIALSLNSGAYIAEIFRAGIQSIDRGQSEAARSLGLSYGKTMRFIVIPQAFRRMLPPLGNEAIMLLKDSSLVSVIGLAEMAYAAKSAFGSTTRVWEPYLTISVMYLVMTFALSLLVSWLERRYGKGD